MKDLFEANLDGALAQIALMELDDPTRIAQSVSELMNPGVPSAVGGFGKEHHRIDNVFLYLGYGVLRRFAYEPAQAIPWSDSPAPHTNAGTQECGFSKNFSPDAPTVWTRYEYRKQPVTPARVHRALASLTRCAERNGEPEAAYLITRSTVTDDARKLAFEIALGRLNILTLDDLRRWVVKTAAPKSEHDVETILRTAIREIANAIATDPRLIDRVEWRDLERILREVFEGLGFQTLLTRPGRDGGFDLELSIPGDRNDEAYLVEVKHWRAPSRPGVAVCRRFIQVVADRKASAGLILSSSGFTTAMSQGILEAESTVIRLGGRQKIHALCREYYKTTSEIWTPGSGNLRGVLFNGTI